MVLTSTLQIGVDPVNEYDTAQKYRNDKGYMIHEGTAMTVFEKVTRILSDPYYIPTDPEQSKEITVEQIKEVTVEDYKKAFEDIRAGIKSKASEHVKYTDYGRREDGLYEALKIIDKHDPSKAGK